MEELQIKVIRSSTTEVADIKIKHFRIISSMVIEYDSLLLIFFAYYREHTILCLILIIWIMFLKYQETPIQVS